MLPVQPEASLFTIAQVQRNGALSRRAGYAPGDR